jgi:hypothetical protein
MLTILRRSALGVAAALTAAAALALPVGPAGAAASDIRITEVAPWGSSVTAPSYAADWFELTNTGASPVTITGWKMDDNSYSSASAVALNGITTIAAGESVVFVEGTATTATAFKTAWGLGSSVQVGYYSGSGVGLSTAGDAVTIFDSSNAVVTAVSFGAATNYKSFDNAAGLGSTTTPATAISTLSAIGTNGAFQAPDTNFASAQIGSPGTIANAPAPVVPEVPVAVLLPIGALGMLGTAVVLGRRRVAA